MAFKKSKRVEQQNALARELRERDTVITEGELKRLEAAGCRVEWRAGGVIVKWTTPGGGQVSASYPALGNGRYLKG